MAATRVIARAPGRVNLIGDHTDYNDGFVLPMAIPFETVVDATRDDSRHVTVVSEGFGETTFTLDTDMGGVATWARYIAAMARFLADDGYSVPGFTASIRTTIPVGASLSSSAALEVAAGFALSRLAGREPDPIRIAQLGQKVENSVIGIQSGIMDQLISACAIAGSASLIDCRDLALTPAPLPSGSTVLIMDTMTRRELSNSEYDERRRSCERAAAALDVPALRDATPAQVERLPDGADRRRARHVATENERVLAAVAAMQSGDCATLGALMNSSHYSLSRDYEVSSRALDAISRLARDHDSCFGARMTGGGFAGCAVALVESDWAGEVIDHVQQAYAGEMHVVPDIWTASPSAGASVDVVD